jgi:hypothetical protein
VFPCLVKSGDTHLSDPKQKQILDKLLKIVQALLIQVSGHVHKHTDLADGINNFFSKVETVFKFLCCITPT